MAFKALFLSHAPDADHTRHNSTIDTGRYQLFIFVVKDQDEAVKVAKDIHEKEKIDAVILCPGFTHNDVAEIFQALGGKVSVNVARGDGPSSRIAQQVIQREYFPDKK
jgi:DNA-binding LacI/PurR family transcriptional regulator